MGEQWPYWLEIDHQALRNNLHFFRGILPSTTKLFPVIKSNAYGHGIVGVGQTMQMSEDVGGVIVNSIEEAILLRSNSFQKRIIVAGAYRSLDLLLAAQAHHIELEIVDQSAISLLKNLKLDMASLAVHIKVNTGLNRLGFNAINLLQAITELQHTANVHVQGLFSHLANSEDPQSLQTITQIARFQDFIDLYPGYENHLCSSVGALLIPEAHFDLVRVGISIYGLWPSKEVEVLWHKNHPEQTGSPLQPVLSFRSSIVHTNQVEIGEPIGYGGSYTTSRPTRIAILPCGYYECLPRAWSNKAYVLVCGKKAPILGRIAMNMTTIDITDIPEANAESIVTIIGKDGQEEVTAEEQAFFADTINYELVTRLPLFIHRKNMGL